MIPDAELQELADCQMPIHGQLSEVARELIHARALLKRLSVDTYTLDDKVQPMSLTDPTYPNEEKEAIEAEFMLHAERDARARMEDYTVTLTYFHGEWTATLSLYRVRDVDQQRHAEYREACLLGACMWDAEHTRLSQLIYDEEYAP